MKISTLRLQVAVSFSLKGLFKKLPGAFAARVLIMVVLCLGAGKGSAQTPYLMSGGDYSELFTNIANTTNWPNGFNGTESQEWTSVATNGTGTLGDGVRITVSTATFQSGSSGGVQRGSTNIQMLSTSTNNSCAIDLLLNFTGRNAGTISFDVATVFNSTGDRDSRLKLFYSIDGVNFTEITGTNLPYTARNNVASSASITTISLPSVFNNSSTARLRFYEYSTNTSGGAGGSQPKISIDNIAITSTAGSSVANPASFTATTSSSSQINLAATANVNTDPIIVAYNSTNSFGTPVNGTSYAVSSSLPTAGTVNYNGVAASLANHTGLTANTQYFYRAFSYDGTTTYSPGISANAITKVATADISTTAITAITATTASTGGTIAAVGTSGLITARGVAYATTSSPTTPVTSNGTGTGTFTSSLSSLSPQTLYYVRAYATNGGGTTYPASDVTFRTLSSPPTVQPTSLAATQTSNTSFSVTLTGSATYPGSGATRAGYLLLYGTTAPALIASPNGIAPGSVIFSGTQITVTETNLPGTPTVTGLSATGVAPSTTYNLLIVPYTWDGTNPETYNYFTTGARTATVTLATVVSLPYTQDFEGATGEWVLQNIGTNKWAIGSATNNGGTNALYISDNSGVSNNYDVNSLQTGTNASLKVDLTGATAASMSFDWKSYGELTGGIYYDYGEVYINNGGADTLLSNTSEFQGTSSFANRRLSLTAYVGGVVTIKFRWRNDGSVGNQPPFAVDNVSITAADVPTLTTTAISSITMNTASTGGNITNDGASAVTARGVVWSTSQNPVVPSANSTSDGTGTGSFTSSITGLTDNTVYYVRAYATNSTGTSYGNQLSFTTSSIAVTTANAGTAISHNSFTANWDAVAGAAGYKLDVSTVNTFTGATSTIASEPFENGLSNFTETTGTGTFSTGTSAGGDRPATSPFAIAGTYSYGKTNGSVTITSNDINTVNAANLQLNFRLAAFSIGSTGNGMDGGDIVNVEISPNGGTNYYSTLRVLGNGNAYWAYSATGLASTSYDGNATPVDFAPTGGGSRTTDGYSTITVTGLPASSNLKIRITLSNDATSERWVIDDLSVSGNPGLFVPGYENLSVAGTSEPVAGLTANTNYYYRVRAVASNSTSANSNTITVLTYKNPATSDFRTKATGNLSSTSTWEYNYTGSLYQDATEKPSASNSVLIQNGHTLTMDENFTVGSGKTFTMAATSAMVIAPTARLTIAGSADLAAQHVTVKSDATGTGAIGTITGTLTGASNVTIERWIKLRLGGTGRAYRLLAPTVNTAGSIKANWMEGGMNTAIGTNVNLVPNFGTQITGAGGNANGFDVTQSNAASLYATTNGVSLTYTAIGNTNGQLNALTGYFLYLRGDRDADMTIPLAPGMPTSSTTLRTTGTLVQGTQTSFTNAFVGGAGAKNLVTNPYASPIDWSLVKAAGTNISDFYTFWDPNFGTRGGFVTVNLSGVPSTGLANKFIQPGQAFFVESTGGIPTVSIQEAHKTTGNNNDVFLTPPPPVEGFRTELYFTEPNAYRRVVDGALVLFNNSYSASVDNHDAKEINNWDENIAIDREGKHLSIEGRPVILSKDTIPLFMNNMKQQAYEFEFTPAQFTNPGLKAELVDNFLNTRTLLSVVNTTVVAFTVTADAASKASDRFKVVFGTFGGLAVDALTIKAQAKNNGVQVDWTSKTETDMAGYEVERSNFGTNFTKVNTTTAMGNSSTPISYKWFDANPNMGTNFYRVKAFDRTGNVKYSDVVRVTFGKGESGITVYPNPMEGKTFKMDMNNMAKGTYLLNLYNNMGQLVYTEQLQHDGSQATRTINLKTDIAKGTYQLQLSSDNGFKTTQTIFKN